MEIRVLGPVELHAGGRRVDLGPRRQRFVLAVLALEANRIVATDRLVDLIWPDGAPATALHAIHVTVSGLRAILAEAGGGTRIDTAGAGYLLRADPHRIDASLFRHLLATARATADDGHRIAVLSQALELWTGPALAGAAPPEVRARLAQPLEEERISGLEERFDAHLRLGRHRAIQADLTALAARHPLRERLAAQLMTTLYRDGQASEALAVYRRIRERLDDELGLDPGAELRRLETAILHGDPALTTAPAGREPAQEHVPQELPSDPRLLVGRRDALAALDATLLGDRPTATPVCVVSGTGGVGKTALVVHWAHRVADRFPDGQLYVNLRGFDPAGPALEPAEAVRRFLLALGVPPDRVPTGVDAQTALYRSQLAGRRVLIVLDNARDSAQVRPLIPGVPGCAVVVTSRGALTGLIVAEGARPLGLDLLTPGDARALFAARIGAARTGAARVDAEPDAADDIVESCARLPLALTIAAARAATSPALPLHALAAELRDCRARLDTFTTDDPTVDVRAVFSWSYLALSAGAARLFRLLGTHPGPDLTLAAAVSLAAVEARLVRALLGELVQTSLAVEHAPGRYAFHDLLREYATELATGVDTDDIRRAALTRALDHYLHTATAAADAIYPHRDRVDLAAPAPGVAAEPLADITTAFAWCEAEIPVVLRLLDVAAADGFDTHAWQLPRIVGAFLDSHGRWADIVATQRIALAAAGRLDDRHAQADAHRLTAGALLRMDRLTEAHTHLHDAIELYRSIGDRAGQGHGNYYQAMAWERQGHHDAALTSAMRALELFRAADHRIGQALALNAAGWFHAQLGDHAQALASCEAALALQQASGDRVGEAPTRDSIGYALHHLGRFPEAITSYEHALALYRAADDHYLEAETLDHLGDTYVAVGDLAAARDKWRQSLTILDNLDHPDADAVRTKLKAATAD